MAKGNDPSGRIDESSVQMRVEAEKFRPKGVRQYARRASLECSVWNMGNLFSILAGPQDTNGRFGLTEIVGCKGLEPPRHIHHREDEALYILEGEATFYIGDEIYEAGPGMFVFMPRGIPHSFTFETDVTRMLNIVAPGAIAELFRHPRWSEQAQALELPPPPAGPPDMTAASETMAEYGIEVVGPPGPPEQG